LTTVNLLSDDLRKGYDAVNLEFAAPWSECLPRISPLQVYRIAMLAIGATGSV
jgi:hypothetical protein